MRDMIISISCRKVKDARGVPRLIAVRNYHCQQCHTFIYTEDAESSSQQPVPALG
jgi:hypothetical protein